MTTFSSKITIFHLVFGVWCCAQTPARSARIPNVSPTSFVSIPTWNNGLYVQWTHTQGPGDRPKIWAFDQSGNAVVSPTEVWFPDTSSARIYSAIGTPDHRVVASVLTWSTSGQMATLLCYIAPSGINSVVRTNQFIASHLQYDPEGVLWAFGHRAASSPADTGGDPRMVRRFSSAGVQLSESVKPITVLNSARTMLSPARRSKENGNSFLLASGARKFIFNASNNSFVEMNNQGKILRITTLKLPSDPQTGLGRQLNFAGMTSSGRIICALTGDEGLWQLDPDALEWTLIDKSRLGGQFGALHGIEGEFAIIATETGSYSWIPIPVP